MCAQATGNRDGGDSLLALALSRPNEAMTRARAVLAAGPGPLDASVAHQVIGIVLREFGDIDAAVRELRTARRLALRGGSADREADALATLGVALVFAGRTRSGRGALNAAVLRSAGLLRGRSLLRRAACLRLLGDYRAALDDLNAAIPVLRAAGDQLWEARALGHRALCLLALGVVNRIAADQRRAEELLAACGQELEYADAIGNRGLAAFRTGQLPDALACFDAAEDLFTALGVHEADLSAQRCAALVAAGLAADALREADAAISRLARVRGQQTMRAELLLVAANCALAAGDTVTAADRAAEAARLFGRQGRRWWRAHAELARVRAAAEGGAAAAATLRDARRCARELADLGSPELPLAQLAAGRAAAALAATVGDQRVAAAGARPRGAERLRSEADEYFAAAAAGRRRGEALSRAAGWLAQARRAELAGDPRRLMRACRRGLAVIDEFRSVFGSSELRARSTAHGAELAALGLRHAVRLGRPRLMLEWSERWRAVALAVPPVRPPADEALQADLAALRIVSDRLTRAAASGQLAAALRRPRPGRGAGPLEQERQRLERAVRARSLHAGASDAASTGWLTGHRVQEAGQGSGAAGLLPGGSPAQGGRGSLPEPVRRGFPFDAGTLLNALGDDRLIELVDVDGELHALVCGGGRVRRFPVGPAAGAAHAVRFARQALRRVAHGPAVSPDEATVHAWLAATGQKLDQVLLGEAGEYLGAESVIIVPPGRLQAVPWGMLPRLRSRAVSVAPSAASWLRAGRAPGEASPLGGRVVLVRGPGLASGGAEVPLLAADYAADARAGRGQSPVVLGGGTATARQVSDAIDGAGLAHIAAHGTFRADSPLFSALRLDDGPLTVYDLERLRRGPRRLILSSCDSGIAAPAGADEVLGLASSLLPLGTAGIVASVVPVNDAAVVPLMTALHRELRGGATLPEALRGARLGLESDPVATATGWSFICLGALPGGVVPPGNTYPAGADVRPGLGMAAQPERAVRRRGEGEAAHLVDRRGYGLAGPRLDLGRSRQRRDELAEQGAVGELDLNREARRLEGEGADRRGLRPHGSVLTGVLQRVIGEAGQLGIDIVPRVGVPPGCDERVGHRGAGLDRRAERGKQCAVVQAVIHVACLP
jgi:tetratricopeptide (TPR) repeat protein